MSTLSSTNYNHDKSYICKLKFSQGNTSKCQSIAFTEVSKEYQNKHFAEKNWLEKLLSNMGLH